MSDRIQLLSDRDKRFFSKVQMTDGCWYWTGTTVNGYGYFWLDGKNVRAHRVAYETIVGPVPDGLVLDHLCRVKNCVRPEHLEAVTQHENLVRGVGRGGRVVRCPQGHPYSGDNLYVYPDGSRSCRTCHRIRSRTYRRRKVVN